MDMIYPALNSYMSDWNVQYFSYIELVLVFTIMGSTILKLISETEMFAKRVNFPFNHKKCILGIFVANVVGVAIVFLYMIDWQNVFKL
jgi:hypothetical protein